MARKIRGWIGRNTGRMIITDSDQFLPDRLINPAEYEEELTAPVAVQVEDKLNWVTIPLSFIVNTPE